MSSWPEDCLGIKKNSPLQVIVFPAWIRSVLEGCYAENQISLSCARQRAMQMAQGGSEWDRGDPSVGIVPQEGIL